MRTPNAEPNIYQSEPYTPPDENPPKKRRTWLWILGWLLIFPLPLTILLLRNKKLEPKVKYGIIAGAWVLYLIIAAAAPKGEGNDTKQPEETPEIVTDVTESSAAATKTTPAPVRSTETTAEPDETEPPSGSRELSADEIRKMVTDGDYSLVTPDFKKMMDAYEAFYDKYIAFMKNYNAEGADTMAMLNDYMDMLSQLEEWTTKMDEIDESTLSDADDAYFLLVTLRIEKKMLEIGLMS